MFAGASPVPLRVPGTAGALTVWEYSGCEPPVLFCHCAGLCGRVWEPILRRLSLPNRFLVWDARGHGDSDKPLHDGAYAWDGFSTDLLQMMGHLEISRGALAVGHSGGAASIMHAEMLAPGSFSRAVLIDAIVAPPAFFPTANRLAVLSRKRKHHFPSRTAARGRLGGKLPMQRWHSDMLDAYVAHGFGDAHDGTVFLKCPGEIEARVYESGGRIDLFDRLGEVQTEALLVTGTESYMLEHVQEQAVRLPHAKLETLADTGHFIPQERPAETAALIDGWLS